MKKIFCLFFLIFSVSLLFAAPPIVHDIQAKNSGGKKIRITWKMPENPEPEIKSLLIYRTLEQITSFEQLRGLEPAAELSVETAGCIDTVNDFKDYYYTIISKTENGVYDLILPSFNSTVKGVHLKSNKTEQKEEEKTETETFYPEGRLRKTPLPYISMIEGINAEPLISDKTAEQTGTLTNGNSKALKNTTLTPYIFEEDLVSPDGGDEYLLFEILKTSFVKKQYSETIDKLNKLAGTNINEETRNRAYFYLGEAYYFNKNYEEAVKCFVKIQQAFPTPAKKWLEASLDKI